MVPGGGEDGAGAAAGGAGEVSAPGGGWLSAGDEAAWLRRAVGAYPARWFHHDTLMLLRGLLEAVVRGRDGAVLPSGGVTPATWAELLASSLPLSLMRTAADLARRS